jgi:2-dehydro-3-deoxyphosphogluconate aldolase / (4S)-4-hydroxy-2-oxoglutarate aldolase
MTQSAHRHALGDLLARAPVIPVLTISRIEDAVPLARALMAGGLGVLEVTLRTPVAFAAIARLKAELPGAIVGAGTLLTPADVAAASKAGADFLVSPGATDALIAAAKKQELPFLPGAATASEAMRLLDHGFRYQKFFPAEASGGTSALKALHAPLAGIVFCPTGGITAANAPAYLALPNVVCVGASWPAPDTAIKSGAWSQIEAAARTAAGLERAHIHRAGQTT